MHVRLTMMDLLTICALIFISKIPQVVCTEQAYFLRKEQKYLANHVIETKQADSEFECGTHCVADGSCASVNYKTSGDGKGRCELNDKTLQEIPDEGTQDPEFTHLDVDKRIDYSYPEKSCSDILQRTKWKTLPSGEYWIVLDNKSLKVHCDMKADGGGWTLITNLVLEQSHGMDWTLTDDYRQIEEYKNNKLALSTYGLRTLGTKFSFKQLRFFCRKKIPGRTFDIATATNSSGKHVIQYFTAQTNTAPKSCGSYYRLSDDNSVLPVECDEWGFRYGTFGVGKWHYSTVNTRSLAERLLDHPAFIGHKAHFLVQQSSGRWECDDWDNTAGYALSSGDFWKIFVR